MEGIMSIFQQVSAWASRNIQAVQQKVRKTYLKQKLQPQNVLHRLKEQIVDKINLSKKTIKTYKIEAITSVLILSTATAAVGIGHTYYQSQVSSVYHVYFHDNNIGVVDQPEVVTDWVEQKIKEESERFEHVNLQADIGIFRFEKVEYYQPTYDNEAVITQLNKEFSIKAHAIRLVVDGQFIGYVADEETVSTILDSFKKDFVSEESLIGMNTTKSDKKNTISIATIDENGDLDIEEEIRSDENKIKESLTLNQPTVVDALIKQDVELEASEVHPSQVLSAEQAKEKLSFSKVEEKFHTVQTGEVLGIIAEQYGLKTQDLLELNPDLTEKSVLQIGQEIVVTGQEPFITVVTVESLKTEEIIKYSTQKKSDSSMYKGDRRIQQRGQDGQKEVLYHIVKENGIVIDREIIEEEIITEPTDQIELVGSKIKPSRGSGIFSWPASGGTITSKFGPRWGRTHAGIDISGVRDRTIKAADNGKVTTAGWHNGYGNYVIINHDNGYQTLYAHMSSLSVKRNQVVTKGEKLGVMGSTGRSTGIHLHFEVIKNGKSLNPLNYVSR